MVEKLISASIRNRWLVLLAAAAIFVWGAFAVRDNPIDAIPDLSENQVIVFTEWMGRSPQIMEDQVTYPLVTNLQGMPKVKNVRGTSMFGMSFVYVIFEDEADIYWARTRVLERLNYAQKLLPEGVVPSLGPDGTGVGHIFWYTLEAPGYDLGEQRSLQDWYVKFALQDVKGVSEVASFGGFQKQYQITVNPEKLIYYNIAFPDVLKAVRSSNNDAGGRKIEVNDIGYIIRSRGYLENIDQIRNIAIATREFIPVTINDVATVQMGGALRLGIFDENGTGEAVGGVVVMRYGENAAEVIVRIKQKMKEVEKGLPKGMKFKIAYDRSSLIEAAVASVRNTLMEEMLVVSLVVVFFLFSLRSVLSILIQLPVTIAASFIFLNALGISSNIMSITGIILALGVIIDNGIIMVENSYRNLAAEAGKEDHKNGR